MWGGRVADRCFVMPDLRVNPLFSPPGVCSNIKPKAPDQNCCLCPIRPLSHKFQAAHISTIAVISSQSTAIPPLCQSHSTVVQNRSAVSLCANSVSHQSTSNAEHTLCNPANSQQQQLSASPRSSCARNAAAPTTQSGVVPRQQAAIAVHSVSGPAGASVSIHAVQAQHCVAFLSIQRNNYSNPISPLLSSCICNIAGRSPATDPHAEFPSC